MPGVSLSRRALAPLSRLLKFEGRTRRDHFWPYMGLLFLVYIVGFVLASALFPFGMGSIIAPIYLLTAILILLAFAAAVRRLHDVGWSGWWMGAYVGMAITFIACFFYARYALISDAGGPPVIELLRFMPFMMAFGLAMNCVGLLVFILCVLDGAPGPNRYGPDPKGRSAP
jgi:uncharacterized membrane protein YhaH (DUF805 family)